jgi:Ca2+-binding RTX toxin-like protein
MKRQRFNQHPEHCACPACMSDQPDFSGDADNGSGRPASHDIVITPAPGGFVVMFPETKPLFSLTQIVEQLQTQWGVGDDGTVYEGNKYAWASPTIHYWIPYLSWDAPDDFGYGEADGFNPGMNWTNHYMATMAFEEWDALIGRSLVQEYDSTRVHGVLEDNVITFAHSSTTEDDASYERTGRIGSAGPGYDYEILQSSIWLSDGSAPDSPWGPVFGDGPVTYGSYGYKTYLHEIGHALGLSHPGTYNAGDGEEPTYAEHAEYSQDTRQYTIMSYFGGWNDDDGDGTWTFDIDENGIYALYPQTPMLHDVLTIQNKYGSDRSTRWSDTIYGFGSTAGNPVFDFDVNPNPILTIWDSGGTNTLDASGFDHDQTINLQPGTFSSIGALVGNVAIAYGTYIDRAIGGSRNDTMYGNSADNWLGGGAGRDYLDGRAGGDTMIGGTGNDTYVVDNTRDVVIENASEGIDEVISFLPSYELRAYFENATVGSAAGGRIVGTNGWGNVLTGNAGADTLDGRTGADTMRGMGGNDIYYVDNAGDRVEEDAVSGTDTVYVTVNGYTLPANVEHGAINTTTGLTLRGNGSVNHLYGNAGIDTLFGAANNDLLFGFGGNDTLDGGLGADRLTGGEGKDIFVLRFGEARGDVVADFEGVGASSGDIIRLVGYGPGAFLTQSGSSCAIRSSDGTIIDTFTVMTSGLSGPLHPADYYFV